MSGAAVIIVRQNRAIRRYHEAGATSAACTRTLRELGIRPGLPIRALVRRGVLVDSGLSAEGEQLYYLDEAAADSFIRARRVRMAVTLTITFVVMIVVVVLAIF